MSSRRARDQARHDVHAALMQAIAEFEARTSAELVISIRPRSGEYLHLNIELGLLAGLLCLAYLLFGEPTFDLHWFLVIPVLAGLCLGVAAAHPVLQRLLVDPRRRRRDVLTAARATFVELGVSNTRQRTGILLYISLAERDLVLVGDVGVRRAVPEEPLLAAEEALRRALPRGLAALPAALPPLGELCGECLPRAHDDVDELPDEVHR